MDFVDGTHVGLKRRCAAEELEVAPTGECNLVDKNLKQPEKPDLDSNPYGIIAVADHLVIPRWVH